MRTDRRTKPMMDNEQAQAVVFSLLNTDRLLCSEWGGDKRFLCEQDKSVHPRDQQISPERYSLQLGNTYSSARLLIRGKCMR